MAKDPVCGMEVDEKTAEHKMEYEGKTYYFCSHECMSTFKRDPEKFIGGGGTEMHDGGMEGGCCGGTGGCSGRVMWILVGSLFLLLALGFM